MTGPLRALREMGVSFASSEVRVLCHHQVRSRERFHAQMSVLLERGYSVLTMEAFIAWASRGQPVRSREHDRRRMPHAPPSARPPDVAQSRGHG